jgi:hypothetical protein
VLLLGDEAQVEAGFSSFGDSDNVDARKAQGLRRSYHRLRNHLEIVLILMQDRCTVCSEHTTGSEIILDAPDGTPRLCGSCGISF